MGSIGRKLARKKKLRENKESKKAMKEVSKFAGGMPKVCGACGADFDNTDKEALNQWRIAVWDDGRVDLACPDCGPSEEEIQASEDYEKDLADQ